MEVSTGTDLHGPQDPCVTTAHSHVATILVTVLVIPSGTFPKVFFSEALGVKILNLRWELRLDNNVVPFPLSLNRGLCPGIRASSGQGHLSSGGNGNFSTAPGCKDARC